MSGPALEPGESTAYQDSLAELEDKIAVQKTTISETFDQIRAELQQMFNFDMPSSAAGSLPCYEDLTVQNFTIGLCFADYNDQLRVIGSFIYGVAFIAAAFIILGGRST